MKSARSRLLFLAALSCAMASAGAASGQEADSISVVAGQRYRTTAVGEWLLGADYRSLWTTPVTLPMLDLHRFAGGLTPGELGGGQQTRSLRLRGEDGREYNFRSVDKFIGQGLPEDLRGTLVEQFLQDQVSSLHPAGAIVATRLLEAAGLLNPGPRLVVMPDSRELGEFRETFGGMLGTIEVHADEAEDETPDFAGAAEVDGAEDIVASVRAGPEERLDVGTYLRERLLSLVMGDWDRHEGQYRWATFDKGAARTWFPVPEDRDHAFADYDGFLLRFADLFFPQAAAFHEEIPPDLGSLTRSSEPLDRLVLGGVEWDQWLEAARSLTEALSDQVIGDAVATMPDEYFAVSGPELIRVLRSRRDALPEAARRYYLRLARAAELHGTDAEEEIEVERLADGSVHVEMRSIAADGESRLLVERTFLPQETKEIRLHLRGGADRVTVRGSARGGPRVRVIGGGGGDTMRNLANVAGPEIPTAFHDSEGDDQFVGANVTVDREPFDGPRWIPEEVRPPPDWGMTRSWFVPWGAYEETQGVLVGGGPTWVWRGFRRFPYAGRLRVRGMFGYRSGDVGIDAVGEFRGVGAAPDLRLHARLSDLDDFRLHGFGNDSPPPRSLQNEVVHLRRRLFDASLRYDVGNATRLGIGPIFELLVPEATIAGRTDVPTSGYGKVGLRGALELDTRATREWDKGGFRLHIDGRVFPSAWDLADPFAAVRVESAGYAPVAGRSLVAVRAGGGWLMGEAPAFDHLSLGGSETLRGYRSQRFTGNASMFGGIELRTLLNRVNIVVRGDLGLLAFAETGRVFVNGESGDRWHAARGAGLWFASLGRSFSATYADGEERRVYLRLGLPF